MLRAQDRERLLAAFGESVRELRSVIGISQEELGLRCGVNRTYVSGIELGNRNPTLWVLWRLSEGLATSPGKLLERAQTRFEGRRQGTGTRRRRTAR